LLPYQEAVGAAVASNIFHELGQLGVMLLLFVVGLQIETGKLRELSGNIVALTVLNLGISSILGSLVLISFGYPAIISALVATALATVAEATVAPILDELGIIKTRIANLILGSGIIDDVAEVGIASLASVIVGKSATTYPSTLAIGLAIILVLAFAFQSLHSVSLQKGHRTQERPAVSFDEWDTFTLHSYLSSIWPRGTLRSNRCWYGVSETLERDWQQRERFGDSASGGLWPSRACLLL